MRTISTGPPGLAEVVREQVMGNPDHRNTIWFRWGYGRGVVEPERAFADEVVALRRTLEKAKRGWPRCSRPVEVEYTRATGEDHREQSAEQPLHIHDLPSGRPTEQTSIEGR